MASFVQTYEELGAKYLECLNQDIETNENNRVSAKSDCDKIHQVKEQLNLLAKQPEWPKSLVPVSPIAYLPATIVHTGEHYVKIGSDFHTLLSLSETNEYLDRKLGKAEETLRLIEEQRTQLEERRNFVTGSVGGMLGDTENMPGQVESDRGTAYKQTTGFYEIIEPYNEEQEKEFYKRRQQRKLDSKVLLADGSKKVDDYFDRLSQLKDEEEENSDNDSDDSIDLSLDNLKVT